MGLCLLVPLWAVREFVRAGGTPLPFDPPLTLVVGGPYALLRNPMQVDLIGFDEICQPQGTPTNLRIFQQRHKAAEKPDDKP